MQTRLAMLRCGASALRTASVRGFVTEATSAQNKLKLNFFLPHKALKQDAAVDMVIVPAASGLMGILPSHAPTVAQLRPGVVEVHEKDDKESYFVSSGFAFVHKDRTDVCAIEAVKLEELDLDVVKASLADAETAVGSAKNDMDRAEAQIGVDVYMAMQGALTT